MDKNINLTAHAIPGNRMQVVLTFDTMIIKRNKLAAEQDIIALFVDELSRVTDKALGFDFTLMNLPCASKAIN